MTYRKISINEIAPVKAQEIPHRETSEHRPEIVISKSKYTEPVSQRKGIFHISLWKIVFTAVLCSASFAVGCTVTNEKIAEYMDSVAAITAGNTKNGDTTEEKNESITFYEKYMTEENTVTDKSRIEFLSAEIISEESETVTAKEEQVAVSGSSHGKAYADGERLYEVVAQDMSASDIHILSNQTRYNPDTRQLLSQTPKALGNIKVNPDEPLVLVLHTHGTECYNNSGEDFVGENTPARSDNINENVVGVGRKLVSVLNDFGIPSVHSEKMCDSESFVNAYSTSYAEAKSYLEKYPSIRLVIDLHRDAIELSDGTRKKPYFEAFGEKNAQIMFVVGTNEAGASHPNWKENLSLALTLQNEIGKDNPRLFRGINLRTASFNQQLSPGYMLLECGSAANTLEEAENAAEIFATGLARVILKYAE